MSTKPTRSPGRPGPKKTKGKPPPKLSNSDLSALDDFCQGIEYDEIPYDSWETCLEALDLSIPIWLDQAAARQGGERLVNFSRAVRETPKSRPARQPASVVIHVPPGTLDGAAIVVYGKGDILCEQAGNLIIIVHVKNE